MTDVATALLSEVATSDLTKLTRILEPAPNPGNSQILDSLLRLAIQEVANGNGARAVGYLADYATRDPRRAEALPFDPALEQVRDKVDAMVSRMTLVARMSAEESLSRAEETTMRAAGKLSNWETKADVLLKVAHRFFDAGGYANYSRTTELAKMVSDAAAPETKPQALAASAAAGVQANPLLNQSVPGFNAPHWTANHAPAIRSGGARRRGVVGIFDEVAANVRDLKDIFATALAQLWHRAPLLVMLLTWFAIGLSGALVFAVAHRIWHSSMILAVANFTFDLWGLGFLAMVGFGFYARIRFSPSRRPSRR